MVCGFTHLSCFVALCEPSFVLHEATKQQRGSGMPRYRYLLIALAGWAAAWTGYRLWSATPETLPPPPPPLTAVEFARLKKLALSACECGMAGGEAKICEREYKTAKAKYKPSEGGTACAPISTEMDCFNVNGREKCIITGYSINGIPESGILCRTEDAQAAENAYSSAFENVDVQNQASLNVSDEKGMIALRKVLARINAGEKMASRQQNEGCV
jgi:hypothetical protein